MFLDFETRSECDIRKSGGPAYARHHTTSIICMSFSLKGEPPQTYIPEDEYRAHGQPPIPNITHSLPQEVRDYIESGQPVRGHNISFDSDIWNHQTDWPKLKPEQLDDTMARACAMALPASLGELGAALNIEMPKNPMGTRLINQMCKPPFKTGPDLLTNMAEYCVRDVEALIEIDKLLRPLSPTEKEVWATNYIVNNRGLPLDSQLIAECIRISGDEDEWLREYAEGIAPGVNVRSQQQVLGWLGTQGVDLPSLDKHTLATTDVSDNPVVEQFLGLREQICSSSIKKFVKMSDTLCEDGRARGNHVYHKATTGRFAGSGIQVQNLPRPELPDADSVADYVVRTGELPPDTGLNTKTALKSLLRSAIRTDSKEFYCADYSAIESRVLFWLAKDVTGLKVYQDGNDLYCATATGIFGYEVTKEQHPHERSIGKAAVLSCGYGGGYRALLGMCESLKVDLGDRDPKLIVSRYRDTYNRTRGYWYDCEAAAMEALEAPNTIVPVNNVKFKYSSKIRALVCALPSGRLIHWPQAEIERDAPTSWGEPQDRIVYMGVGRNYKWTQLSTYGGDIVQSITQGTARDLLCHSLVRMEKEGFEPVLHVHDEIMVEQSTVDDRYQEFQTIMRSQPEWAYGLPIDISAWRNRRYQK